MSPAAAPISRLRRLPPPVSRFVLPGLFLVLVLPLLVLSAVIVPAGEVPDEVAHLVRAEGLLHGAWLGHRVRSAGTDGRVSVESGVTADPAMLAAGFAFSPATAKKLTLERLRTLLDTKWSARPVFVAIPNTSVYLPLFYVPAALGLQAARWAGLHPYRAIQAARLSNVLAFAAAGLAALLLARRARALLFAVLALPMTVSLAGSGNQDGLVIATACLAAALLTRGSPGPRWAGIAALALLIAAKPVYVPLAALAGALPPGRRPGLGARAAAMLAASVPGIIWFVLAQRLAAVPFVRGAPYSAGPLWPGPPGQVFAGTDAHEQMRVFLHDPGLLLLLPLQGLRDEWWILLQGLVGILGTLDVLLPAAMYTLWFVALVAALAGTLAVDAPRQAWPRWVSALGLLAVAASLGALFDGQYLSWSLVGAARVDGMQGRYLIPLLPLLAVSLPGLAVPGAGAARAACAVPGVVAATVSALVVPLVLLSVYYLR